MQYHSNTEGSPLDALILACSETVKAIAWKFARSSSDRRVDVEEFYSIGMVEVCECVATGRMVNAVNPIAYLCGTARLAMCEEWRRLHVCSIDSLDALLSDEDGFCLADTLSDRSPAPVVVPSKHERALHGALTRLSTRQRAAVRRMAGLPGYGTHSRKETARAVRTSPHGAHMLDLLGRHKLANDARLRKVMGVEVEQ